MKPSITISSFQLLLLSGVSCARLADVTPDIERTRSSIVYFSVSCCAFDLPDVGLLSETISTSAGSKPASTVEIRRNVPSSSPAPMMSVSEIASWATTSAFPAVSRPWPSTIPRALALSAALGATRAARHAGASPNASPVNTAIATLNHSTVASSRRSRKIGRPAGDRYVTSSLSPHRAITSPRAAPNVDSNKLSVTSCRITRPRAAPSATRIAISRRRTAARASNKFATFAQAIKSTTNDHHERDECATILLSQRRDAMRRRLGRQRVLEIVPLLLRPKPLRNRRGERFGCECAVRAFGTRVGSSCRSGCAPSA